MFCFCFPTGPRNSLRDLAINLKLNKLQHSLHFYILSINAIRTMKTIHLRYNKSG